MNVSDKDTDDLIPVMKMVFYENQDNVYAEYCKVVRNGKVWRSTSMKPVSYIGLQYFINSIQPKISQDSAYADLTFNRMIPNNVLHFRERSLLPDITWFVKSQVRQIKTTKKSGLLLYPHLIFQVRNNKLNIYAVKTSNLKPTTIVFNAPFSNVYGNGDLCFGTMNFNDFAKGDYIEIMRNFENAFFNSTFTQEIMSQNRTRSSTSKLLQKMIVKKNPKRFPAKEFIKYGSLKDVIG
jgi:PRTRC genetic system protein B